MSAVVFEQIPVNFVLPGPQAEIVPPKRDGLAVVPLEVLLIGQKLAGGTEDELVLKEILASDASDAAGWWGTDSMLHQMAQRFKKVNKYTKLLGIGIDDLGAGTARQLTYTVTGPATAAGTAKIHVGDVTVRFGVANGDTAIEVAAAIVAALDAASGIPTTQAVGENPNEHVVTATARHKGLAANDLVVSFEDLPAGIAVAVAQTVAGAGNPDVAEIVAAIAGQRFKRIVLPWNDTTNLDAQLAEMEARWLAPGSKDGFVFVAKAGSHATLVSYGNAKNHRFVSVLPTHTKVTLPYLHAAEVAAFTAAKADQTAPFQGITLSQTLPEEPEDRLDDAERNSLILAGISTDIVNASGKVTLESIVTMRTKNDQNADDDTWRYPQRLFTLSAIRDDLQITAAQDWPGYKIVDDAFPTEDIGARKLVRAKDFKSWVKTRSRLWYLEGWIENLPQFDADLKVIKNGDRFEVVIRADLVNMLVQQWFQIHPII